MYADKKDKLGYYRKKENALEEKLNGYYSYSHELAIYNEAIAAFPDSPMAYLYRANFKDQSGNYKPEDILQDLDKAAALKTGANAIYDEEIYKRLRAKYGK